MNEDFAHWTTEQKRRWALEMALHMSDDGVPPDEAAEVAVKRAKTLLAFVETDPAE